MLSVVMVLAGALIGAVVTVIAVRRTPPRPAAVTVAAPLPAGTTSSERQLIAALDALPVGIALADAAGTVRYRNTVAAHSAGARHGDILVDEAVEGLLLAAASGEHREQVLDLFGPPKKRVLIHAFPLDDRTGAVATIEDITERFRLDAVRTDFVANISHELKTPVGAMSILAETLQGEDDPDVINRLAGRIVRETGRLAHTIDDLLELSRLELGGPPAPSVVGVKAVVDEAIGRVKMASDRREVTITTHHATADGAFVGERRQLVSAVANLLDNAIKYSERGGRVEVVSSVNDGHVELHVVDHGMGIPTRDLDRVFERFYRVDRARSRETGGTGLGLSIVRHVATNHGGEVSAHSVEGEGSRFVLRLPAFAEPSPVPPSPAPMRSNRGS
jgi:two-component system, OmpR family, sensor histidine kinase SenX3